MTRVLKMERDKSGMTTTLLIKAIQYIHMAVLLFVIAAGFSPWREVWLVHVVFVPLMFIHWKTNRNRCVLTQIESRLKGEREVSESGFIKRVITKFIGREPSERALQRTINSILVVAWSLSAIRSVLSN